MPLTKETAHRKDLNTRLADMQHRHFATIATIIRELNEGLLEPCDAEGTRNFIADVFADRLAETNPNFDRRRFLLACKAN